MEIVTKTFQAIRMKVHAQHLTAEEEYERVVICGFEDQLKDRMIENLPNLGGFLEETV